MRERGVVRAGKRFVSLASNEDMDDFIKNVESLEKTGLLIDGANETVKNQVKKKKVDFLGLRWYHW